MARLPTPGGDNGTWGNILNTFLDVSHQSDGTLKPSAISGAGAAMAANNLSDLQSAAVARTNLGLGSAAVLSSTVGGDLDGSLPNPTVAKLNGVALPSSAPSAGQVLTSDGTELSWITPPSAPVTSVNSQTGAVDLTTADLTDTDIAAPTNDQVLTYDSTSEKWTNQAPTVGYQGWQFRPETYGAKGDLKITTDGAMTSGSAVLTCGTSAPFTSTAVDGGKLVHVGGAGGSAVAALCATIVSVQSSTQATLSVVASSTVSGGIVAFATNDTAAVKDALSAAFSYAQSSGFGYGQVLLSGFYALGGTPTIGGSTLGNAYLPLPVNAMITQKVTLEFRGPGDATAQPVWDQEHVQLTSAGLICLSSAGTADSTYGPTSIIGGPFDGYGAVTSGLPTFDNLQVVLNGITLMAPYNGTCGGADFYGVAEANLWKCSYQAISATNYGGDSGYPVPSTGATSAENFTNFGFPAIRMPSAGNNANSNIDVLNISGAVNGLWAAEHTTWQRLGIQYCYAGIVVYFDKTLPHNEGGTYPITGLYTTIGECNNGLDFESGVPVFLNFVGFEGMTGDIITDQHDYGLGNVSYTVANGSRSINGGSNLLLTHYAWNGG